MILRDCEHVLMRDHHPTVEHLEERWKLSVNSTYFEQASIATNSVNSGLKSTVASWSRLACLKKFCSLAQLFLKLGSVLRPHDVEKLFLNCRRAPLVCGSNQ